MAVSAKPTPVAPATTEVQTYDMRQALAENRLLGLIRMAAGFRRLYVGAIASLAVSSIARTLTLLLLAYFVDEVLFRDDVRQVVPLVALGFLGLALVEGSASYLSGRWAARTAEQVAWRLRNYLYDHLQRLTFSYHDRMQTGELLQRATSDVEAIRRFFVEQGVGIGRILILFVVNFIAIMTIRVDLALLSIVVIPVLVLVSLYFFKKISASYEAMQDQEAKLSTTLQENLSGVRVVKAFARQEYEREKFEADNWEKFLRGRHLLVLNAVYWPLTDILVGAQQVGAYLLGAIMAINGTITVGQYMAFVGMLNMIVNPMRQLGRLIVHTSTGMVSYDRVSEIIRQTREPLHEDSTPPVERVRGEIVFDRVDFHYDNETPVLHEISFRCEPGQTIALLGSTGSGKTSLVNLLPRFYDYTGGSITLDGVELRDYPRSFLRANIGVVEQEPFLFSRTIRENITYGVGREVSDEEVFAAARAAAVHDVIEEFPDGYRTLVGERGVTLSGGQKQRIALARTLLKNPRILILDDATSSVDTETEAAIRHALRQMMQDRTSLVIAHRVQTLMHADLVLVLDEGRIVQQGTHSQLIAQEGIYRETFDMQSRIEEALEKEIASA
ncbi:MAG: ABC transporter ATP-binding protein [Phototrophicaceae bacterium]